MDIVINKGIVFEIKISYFFLYGDILLFEFE